MFLPGMFAKALAKVILGALSTVGTGEPVSAPSATPTVGLIHTTIAQEHKVQSKKNLRSVMIILALDF
jgi:hypothetical protein